MGGTSSPPLLSLSHLVLRGARPRQDIQQVKVKILAPQDPNV